MSNLGSIQVGNIATIALSGFFVLMLSNWASQVKVLARVDVNLTMVQHNLDRLERSVCHIDTKLDKLNKRINQVENLIMLSDGKLDVLDKRVSNLEMDMREIRKYMYSSRQPNVSSPHPSKSNETTESTGPQAFSPTIASPPQSRKNI